MMPGARATSLVSFKRLDFKRPSSLAVSKEIGVSCPLAARIAHALPSRSSTVLFRGFTRWLFAFGRRTVHNTASSFFGSMTLEISAKTAVSKDAWK
jgi:hypothetical protein